MKWLSFSVIALLSLPVGASQVEVLHWWTSGGEAKAVEVLKSEWAEQGNQWNDFAVQGGGGKSAMTVLKSRALAANPPEAAHLKGYELHEWASLGFLRDLSPMAEHLGWYPQLSPMVRDTLSQNGALMAVPTGIHRVNWLWLNRKLFERLGLTPPTDWEHFMTVAEQLKAQGVTPLAIGNEPWQLAVLFETVALGEGGKAFYRKAFLEQDSATLTGPDMVRVLTRFQQLRAYVPEKYAGLKWHQATNLLESGGAAMQIMGDWEGGAERRQLQTRRGHRLPAKPGKPRPLQLQPGLHRHVQATGSRPAASPGRAGPPADDAAIPGGVQPGEGLHPSPHPT